MKRRRPRTQLTLSAEQQAELERQARRARLPAATYAARFVLDGLARTGPSLDAAVQEGCEPNRRRRPTPRNVARWLPPEEHLEAIDALRARYPGELRELRSTPTDRLLADTLLTEQLAALAHWRKQLDDGDHDDVRMELAFAASLQALAESLRRNPRRLR